MPINARPQNNGNTVEDFTAAFYALGDAEKALAAALVSLRGNVFHGRNYQHLAEGIRDAVFDDERKMEGLRVAMRNIADLRLDIVAAIQPERR